MDAKQLRLKLIGSEDERAVSPVIGVILMVAITVILAAVIAAFVLDMGQGQSASPQAGYQINDDGSSITVKITSIENLDRVGVYCGSRPSSDLPQDNYDTSTTEWVEPSVGDSITPLGTCSSTDDVEIIGVYDGSESTLN
ncbi:type IV pilin N-terminal domain-containing protein [Natrinema zhouii]|uniref:Type IV pilin n=1 Tax=Natrinema zhouii TaxID=1710539 RepID=A0A7D6GYN7_9EURY|nr:type IV pilin N-terminal domain-containing protein [Natrinema zhouii]QLK25105.1 type IV pilin N-terminal domain-containing protein [Natrinema zhouii]